MSKITHSPDLLWSHNADRDRNGHIYFKSHYARLTYFHCNFDVCCQQLRIDNTTRFRYGHADCNLLEIRPVLLRVHGAWRERNNEKRALYKLCVSAVQMKLHTELLIHLQKKWKSAIGVTFNSEAVCELSMPIETKPRLWERRRSGVGRSYRG